MREKVYAPATVGVNVGFGTVVLLRVMPTGGVHTQPMASPFGSELALPSSVTSVFTAGARGAKVATAVGGAGGGGGPQFGAGKVAWGNGTSCPTFRPGKAANVPLTRNGKSLRLSGTGGVPIPRFSGKRYSKMGAAYCPVVSP